MNFKKLTIYLSIIVFLVFISLICWQLKDGNIIEKINLMAGKLGVEVYFKPLETKLALPYVELVYFDKNLKNLKISLLHDTVNLDEVATVDFLGKIKNIGDTDLLISTQNLEMQSPRGINIGSESDEAYSKNFPLPKGQETIMTLGTLSAPMFHDVIKNNYIIYIHVKIAYQKEQTTDIKNLDITIECSDRNNNRLLPLFKTMCTIEQN